jgi:hypothetical protein
MYFIIKLQIVYKLAEVVYSCLSLLGNILTPDIKKSSFNLYSNTTAIINNKLLTFTCR